MPDIRELTDDEHEQLMAAQQSCQDGDDAGPGDDDFDQDGGE